MPRRNGPVVKSVESVLRLEGSLWRERFVEEVGTREDIFINPNDLQKLLQLIRKSKRQSQIDSDEAPAVTKHL